MAVEIIVVATVVEIIAVATVVEIIAVAMAVEIIAAAMGVAMAVEIIVVATVVEIIAVAMAVEIINPLEQKVGKTEAMGTLLKILNMKVVGAGEKGEFLMRTILQVRKISNPFLQAFSLF